MVASIICSVASATPLSASPSRITSQMPLSAQRRNCRKIEFQLPNSSGRSRHGAPVRINQNTASSTRRWLRGGRPPPRWIRNGSKYAHSSSVISPRIKAASQRAALNQFAILTSIGLSTRPSTTLADLLTPRLVANPFSAMRAPLLWWLGDKFEDGLTHGGQCRLRWRPADSFFPVLLF